MTNRLETLEVWAAGILGQLEPTSRKRLIRSLGQTLLRNQQQRIITQRSPDGRNYVPHRPRYLRCKKRANEAKISDIPKTENNPLLKNSDRRQSYRHWIKRANYTYCKISSARVKRYSYSGAPDVRYENREVIEFKFPLG